uniref:Uncharacterized protein n=1 Tax=Anopheles melas TaxID=34690 RepID=A0A182TYH5_9DIPT
MSHGTSGSTTGDGPVNVSLVEIGDLCFATKVNDKQIIFCTRQRWPCTETGVNSGRQDVRKGPGSVTGGSVPRQLSAGADRQPRAEVVASCSSGSGSSGGSSSSAGVVAVSVNWSGELVDSWCLAGGKHWLRVSDEEGSVDDSAATVAAQWSSRAGKLDRNDDPGPAVRLIFDDGGTIKRPTAKADREAGRGAQKQFEQFCVKCRVYLFEHFAKIRSNVGVMSREISPGATNHPHIRSNDRHTSDLQATNRHRLIDTGQCTRDRHATLRVNVGCGGGGDSGGRPITGAKCSYDKQQNLRRCDDSVLLPVSRGRAHLARSRTSQRRRQPVAMRASLYIFLTGARARLCVCVCVCRDVGTLALL